MSSRASGLTRRGVAGAALAPLLGCATSATTAEGYDLTPIARVWSGHSVDFALAETPAGPIVAYYNEARRMTLASRGAHGDWRFETLDSVTGWDSHNYIAMALDEAGHLHVVGNMHNDPLIYFRSARAGDIGSMARVATMVARNRERRMTYPVFLKDGAGRLVFKYRDGGSGAGNEIYNVYDVQARRWRALLAAPLVDGEGQRNAYFVGPTLGPDDHFHLAWVWRDAPDAATNHDLCYAKSHDLVRWMRSDDTPLALPITLARAEIVDPVPISAGMINNNTVVGFDPAGRVMITYHKFDAAGDTQVFVARREEKHWRVAQASAWRGFRWDFGGQGSLDFRLRVKGAEPLGADRVRVPVVRDGVASALTLDAESLALIEERPEQTLADRVRDRIGAPAGMQINTVEAPSGVALAWAALPPHNDQPLETAPAPTMLYLVSPRSR